MKAVSDGIRIIPGTTDFLVVAPHSPVRDGEFQNDLRTGIIAEEIQRALGCFAIINDRFVKPTPDISKSLDDYLLDLFRIDHSKKVAGYLDTILETVGRPGKTLVLWVHGITDDKALFQGQYHVDQGVFGKDPSDLDALIGCGQGGDPKTGEARDRPSASRTTVVALCKRLTEAGMTTLMTQREAINYRGRDAKRLNQWFNQQGYGLDRVESVQLEIREGGFRDTEGNAMKTGRAIARALSGLRSHLSRT
jgi:hypothetical protein